MQEKIKFTKMHGLGNDYIYVDTMNYDIPNPAEYSIEWSKFHTGIGSDGLVLIDKSSVADFKMRIFNADGSEAQMCGNASRCIGKFLHDKGYVTTKNITLETLAGIKTLNLNVVNNEVESVRVDMGKPSEEQKNLKVVAGGKEYTGTHISMGNPHYVIFVDDISKIDLPNVGPLIENNELFPNRINVEFAQVLDENNIRMRVWERGSGITQACGTGACATAVAAIINNKSNKKVNIIMDGGSLNIELTDSNNVLMTGPATTVFEGEINL